MADVTVSIRRRFTTGDEDSPEARQRLHKERRKMVHGLVDALTLDVKAWGETDSDEPHEVVEVIIALGTAGVFTAMVSVFQAWLRRDVIETVEMSLPDGRTLNIRDIRAQDVPDVARALGLA